MESRPPSIKIIRVDFYWNPIFLIILSIKMFFFCSQKVYELVVRHFLACVSQPAVGAETTVEIDIAGEGFSSSGRAILAVSNVQSCLYVFSVVILYVFKLENNHR